jgi:hypothetical protein
MIENIYKALLVFLFSNNKLIDIDRDYSIMFIYLFQGNRGEQGLQVRIKFDLFFKLDLFI